MAILGVLLGGGRRHKVCCGDHTIRMMRAQLLLHPNNLLLRRWSVQTKTNKNFKEIYPYSLPPRSFPLKTQRCSFGKVHVPSSVFLGILFAEYKQVVEGASVSLCFRDCKLLGGHLLLHTILLLAFCISLNHHGSWQNNKQSWKGSKPRRRRKKRRKRRRKSQGC